MVSLSGHTSVPDNCIYNVILVGQFGAGKTTLMMTATSQPTPPGSEVKGQSVSAPSSRGVDYRVLRKTLNGSIVELKIFDTGDIERHNELTANYYRYANLALLIYDTTNIESFDLLHEDLLEDTQRYAPAGCSKVVVGTKVDLNQRACGEGIVEAWAEQNSLKYFELDARSHEQVSELFTTLMENLQGRGKPRSLSFSLTSNAEKEKKARCCG